MSIFIFFVFYSPNSLGHPVNYIPADSMHTPSHIVPEWYFLPFYAMLRSVPDKVGGIITMGSAILILFLIPFLNTSEIRSTTFRPLFKIFYWFFVIDFFVLIWSGEQSLNEKCVVYLMFVSQAATVYYFCFFLILVPLIGLVESRFIHYKNIFIS
jgi:ubiquinol-cytochrome c reductase cytochrome b subunit